MLPVNILLVPSNIFPLLSPTQRGLGEEAHPQLLAAGAGHVVDDVVPCVVQYSTEQYNTEYSTVPRVVGDVLHQQRPGPRSRLAPTHLNQVLLCYCYYPCYI